MSYDWSRAVSPADAKSDEADRFPFWSRSEVARVGVIIALAALPLTVSTFESPSATAKGVKAVTPASTQAGQLRAVRIIDLDLKTLTPSTLADAD
jgi:hypothetical protein